MKKTLKKKVSPRLLFGTKDLAKPKSEVSLAPFPSPKPRPQSDSTNQGDE